jgi:hypothetical protein
MAVGAHGDFLGHDERDVADMNRAEQIEMMVDWFKFHFEDPANDTPYSKDQGGYVFLWGGPFDADEQIQAEFSDTVEFDTMQAAVSQIQSDGTFDWAPTTQGSFYEHPEEEQDDYGKAGSGVFEEGVYEDGVYEADQDFTEPSLNEPEARDLVIEKLDQLQRQMAPIIAYIEEERRRPPMMGHNNPPEELEIFHEVSRDEWLETRDAVAAAQAETDSENPDRRVLARLATLLKTVTRKLVKTGVWIIGAAAAGVIGTAAGGMIFDRANTIEILNDSSNAIQTWISTLPPPF